MLALKANHMMVVSLLDNAQYVHSYAEGEVHLVWVWWGGVGWGGCGGVGWDTALLCGGHMCFTYPAAWDESGDETLDESEASDIMTGPKEFSRSYDPTQPSADVLARRRSSVQRTASPQIGKGSEVGQCTSSGIETVQSHHVCVHMQVVKGQVEVCPQLKEFLQPLDMDKYLSLFAAEEMDFETLLSCSEDMLKQIGIV